MIKVVNGKKTGFTGKDKVYVGRSCYGIDGSILNNNFRLGVNGNRDDVVDRYRSWLWLEFKKEGAVYRELVRLARKVKNGENLELVCWCAPQKCHGDVVKSCIEWMLTQDIY